MKTLSLIFIEIAFLTASFNSCSKPAKVNEEQSRSDIKLENILKNSTSTDNKGIQGKRLQPRFKVTEYCKQEDQDSVMFYWGKFGNKTPFNISVRQENNQLKITYRVIDDCCLKFRNKASLDSTKLNIFHVKMQGNPCECKCMYEFEFLIRKIDMPQKLFINKEEVQF